MNTKLRKYVAFGKKTTSYFAKDLFNATACIKKWGSITSFFNTP